MSRRSWWLPVSLALTVQAGCASSADVVPADLVPMPASPGGVGADYRIAAGDVIEVTVFDAPELSRPAGVSERGEVSLPLLGAVPVGGLTVQQIEASLESRLRERYMRDPRVTVAVREVRSSPIYVMGEVNRPGAYPMDGARKMTVLQAVSLGEGLRTMAAKDRATILRTIEGGDRIRIQLNLDAILSGESRDPELQPHDIVYIPTNSAKSLASGMLDALLRLVTFRTIF